HVVYANADITLNELVELMFHARYAGYPVLDVAPVEDEEVKTSMVVGIVTFRDLQKVPPQQRGSVRVREVMNREVTFMDADTNASDAVTKIHQIESGRLLVTQDDTVVGIVSRTDIMRAIQLLSFRYGGRS
ncbi:MAG: CBS domain-containing protein, partial [Methermicoccaceae archaeon]